MQRKETVDAKEKKELLDKVNEMSNEQQYDEFREIQAFMRTLEEANDKIFSCEVCTFATIVEASFLAHIMREHHTKPPDGPNILDAIIPNLNTSASKKIIAVKRKCTSDKKMLILHKFPLQERKKRALFHC